MSTRKQQWMAGGLGAALLLGGAMAVRGGNTATLLGLFRSSGGSASAAARSASPKLLVHPGSISNSSGVGGEEIVGVARDSMASALQQHNEVTVSAGAEAEAERVIRAQRLQGHQFDATIRSITQRPDSIRVVVSVAVSSLPGRTIEFEAEQAVTISAGDDPAETQTNAVRRAVSSAVQRAIGQLETPGT